VLLLPATTAAAATAAATATPAAVFLPPTVITASQPHAPNHPPFIHAKRVNDSN
jgi:hypothetical protein